MNGPTQAHQALLFPELPLMPADTPVPAVTRMRRAGHKRRLAEAATNGGALVAPTLPCRHGQCKHDPRYRALPGRGHCAWCPGCPGHVKQKDGGVACLHD